ncbi:Glycosyltransferase, catalytic subunit of cellulose synthase and poly-beta-1,6-N-acetylglucosamine synthase [Klenkia soli]|uniref:Glycosyltransferase, catalytic subunit of cellulose synthase and poly-beta-1,6-N-acetylglucosamine synthase n=1 Tax=Klenkia soli TaxID=1052260 RepID=A0A1H0K8Q0_9ACTN|nr:glycosyltransferase [Klenkia soli]SDO52267.1 Glycosyltransferase, catalytic subunit of cellulose synthase and poly-beta-1,6-N-acetylglucosamine synthase [Klenkia soli]
MAERRLGDVLLETGVITPEQLTEGLAQARRISEPLGSVLLAKQWITRRQLYVALADVWGTEMAFVDPVEVDPDLAQLFPYPQLAREMWVPLRTERTDDGELQVVVASSGRPNEHIEQEVRERTGIHRVHQLVTTDWDVQRALRTVWREEVVHEAVSSLAERRPEESASTVFTWPQVASAVVAAVAVVVGLVLDFPTTVVVLLGIINVTIGLAVGAKAVISTVGTASETVEQVTDEEVAALTDAELPHYTILVPVYKEAGIVGLLMRNLSSLDYPREKLEILLLLEEDDPETLQAALAAAPPDIVRILVVPHSMPKTKPRACNVGLSFARGDLVVIYDAEDRPDPDQLKKSVVAFAKGGQDLVCVQAALNYFNAEENLLTRMFTLEYSSWFDYTLPGLDAMRLPIPLGGTSNHFRADMLRELGGWDPFNVTEDADLGVRASARGGRVAVVNSTTYEEANMAVGNWLRQRSRWIKGYMQTFLVHSRHPLKLVRAIGLRQTIGFLLTIGGTPATFLLTPILWVLFILYLAFPRQFSPALPPWLEYVSLANLLIGNGLIVYLSLLAGFKRRSYGLVAYALLSPLYWMLHSIASYKAAWQLVTKPFYWEKTQHGLTSHTQDDEPVDDPALTRPAEASPAVASPAVASPAVAAAPAGPAPVASTHQRVPAAVALAELAGAAVRSDQPDPHPLPAPEPDPTEDPMPPLDLDDLAALQAELEVLDERDLIAELAPTRVSPRPVPRVAPPTGVHPAALPVPRVVAPPVTAMPVPPVVPPPTGPTTDPGPTTRPPVRRLPPVPAPVDRPVRRTGPLPDLLPTRDAAETAAVDEATPARAVHTRPPVPGMTVVRVLPTVPAVAAGDLGTRVARGPRHAALPPAGEPVGRGLLSWAVDGTTDGAGR